MKRKGEMAREDVSKRSTNLFGNKISGDFGRRWKLADMVEWTLRECCLSEVLRMCQVCSQRKPGLAGGPLEKCLPVKKTWRATATIHLIHIGISPPGEYLFRNGCCVMDLTCIKISLTSKSVSTWMGPILGGVGKGDMSPLFWARGDITQNPPSPPFVRRTNHQNDPQISSSSEVQTNPSIALSEGRLFSKSFRFLAYMLKSFYQSPHHSRSHPFCSPSPLLGLRACCPLPIGELGHL